MAWFKSQEPKEEGKDWFKKLFEINNIDPVLFLAWFTAICDKKFPKKNTFVVRGPPDCGKSLIVNTLLENYPSARIGRQGELTPFYLQNLTQKPIGILEEPRIIDTFAEDMKLLLGGEPLEVACKNAENELLKRTPIFITTNRQVGEDCMRTTREAFKTRFIEFELLKPIGYELERPRVNYSIHNLRGFLDDTMCNLAEEKIKHLQY